jgi:hypothetical protein
LSKYVTNSLPALMLSKAIFYIHDHVPLLQVHDHKQRSSHVWRYLSMPIDHCPVPRRYMELFAVVCIETSHYVAFVKCGSGSDAPWCVFDSMADRKGMENMFHFFFTLAYTIFRCVVLTNMCVCVPSNTTVVFDGTYTHISMFHFI